MLSKVKRTLYLLNFNEDVPVCDVAVDLPFLIDTADNVILGNSMRGLYNLTDKVDCIVVQYDKYIMQPLAEIEISLMEENDRNRIKQIESELKQHFRTFDEIEHIRLFDLPPDDTLITEDNFKRPPDYNFEKGKRKDESEGDDAGLFGRT